MRVAALALLFILMGDMRAADLISLATKDSWSKAGTADFELYTNAGDAPAREALRELQIIRGFFNKASPLPVLDQFPARIIVFKSLDQFGQYAVSESQRAFFVSGLKRDFIAMSDSPDEYRYAIHEYMHLIIRHSGLRLPIWLNEGWAEVYSTMRPVNDGVAVGDLIESRMQTLNTDKWLKLETLTTTDVRSEAYKNNSAATALFYAQSWALTHMLFLAPDYSDKFPKFLMAMNRGRDFNAACEEAYGKTGQQVFTDLTTYFQRKKMYGRVFKAPLGKPSQDLPVTTADTFQVRLVLADLLAAVGRGNEAEAEYARLEQERPDAYDVAESRGYLAASQKDIAGARANFERAFARNDPDPQMCFALANLELATKGSSDLALDALERSLRSKPDYIDAQIQLGLLHVQRREYESAASTLMKIEKIGPDAASRVYSALAYAHVQTGDLVQARRNIETAKQYAHTEPEMKALAAMLELIDARANSATPPHPGEKIQRIRGTLRAISCSPQGNRAEFSTDNRLIVLSLPESRAIEFTHAGPEGLTLTCGPQKPVSVIVDYAPGSVMNSQSQGVIRRIEY